MIQVSHGLAMQPPLLKKNFYISMSAQAQDPGLEIYSYRQTVVPGFIFGWFVHQPLFFSHRVVSNQFEP